jgi:DNA-binding HxlR family transcriptional regulator
MMSIMGPPHPADAVDRVLSMKMHAVIEGIRGGLMDTKNIVTMVSCQRAGVRVSWGPMPKKAYGQACPVAKSLELVGERWTLLLVRDLLRSGARRFQDFHASLPGIAPALLSERLKAMEEHGLVARRFYSEHPPRAEYVLTDKGRELGFVIGALASWGSQHVHRDTVLVSGDCGHEVQMRYFCPTCEAGVHGSSVTVRRRGPRRRTKKAAAPQEVAAKRSR